MAALNLDGSTIVILISDKAALVANISPFNPKPKKYDINPSASHAETKTTRFFKAYREVCKVGAVNLKDKDWYAIVIAGFENRAYKHPESLNEVKKQLATHEFNGKPTTMGYELNPSPQNMHWPGVTVFVDGRKAAPPKIYINDKLVWLNGVKQENYHKSDKTPSGHGLSGYDASGYLPPGIDPSGHGLSGHDASGYVPPSANPSSYDQSGHGLSGYDASGYFPSSVDLSSYVQSGHGLSGYTDLNPTVGNVPLIDPSGFKQASSAYGPPAQIFPPTILLRKIFPSTILLCKILPPTTFLRKNFPPIIFLRKMLPPTIFLRKMLPPTIFLSKMLPPTFFLRKTLLHEIHLREILRRKNLLRKLLLRGNLPLAVPPPAPAMLPASVGTRPKIRPPIQILL